MNRNLSNEGIININGKITAKQIAVGKNARAIQNTNKASAQDAMQQIQTRLDELMQALDDHSDALENPEEVRDSTKAVAEELSKDKPNKLTITSVLNGIASSVQSVTTIAVAVEALKNAIGKLM
jgi:hypothetical protein